MMYRGVVSRKLFQPKDLIPNFSLNEHFRRSQYNERINLCLSGPGTPKADDLSFLKVIEESTKGSVKVFVPTISINYIRSTLMSVTIPFIVVILREPSSLFSVFRHGTESVIGLDLYFRSEKTTTSFPSQ